MLQLPSPLLGNVSAITITTPDFDKSISFYALLGFKEVARADWPFPWVQVSDGALLIMLRKDSEPYIALTYFVAELSAVVKDLEGKGILFTERAGAKEMVKRFVLQSPDGINVRLVGITDGFSQPPGPGMLQLSQEDYMKPEKYVNKVCGVFGELAHPVKDLKASVAFWRLLGFTTLSEFAAPYPWAVMTDGLNAIGLHQTEHFNKPAITFFAADMRQKIARLKGKGLSNYTDKGKSNITINTPEDQQIFLFQMGAEQEAMQPKLSELKLKVIETERMLLKELNPELMKHILSEYADDDIIAFLGLQNSEVLAAERQKLAQGLSWYRATARYFLMTEKASGKVLGVTGYHTWYTAHARAEIGYHIIDDADKGKGYMREAMREVIDYGFKDMELNRIEAMVSPANEPSLRLLTRCGFVKEGVLRSHYCKNGRIEDSAVYALLRSEYREGKE